MFSMTPTRQPRNISKGHWPHAKPMPRTERQARHAHRIATAETKVMRRPPLRTPEALGNDSGVIAALLSKRWTIARVLGAIVSGALLGFAIAWLIVG